MKRDEPRDWSYIGRAGQRHRWRRLRAGTRTLHRALGSGLDKLGAAILDLVRWLLRWLRGVIIGEGRRRRIGLAEAIIWLAVAAVAGAFLLLLSQQMLALAIALGILGMAYALRELS